MDADKLSDLLGYIRENNFARKTRNELETLRDDDNFYTSKTGQTFGLRKFKNRKPFLSFTTKRVDDPDWIGSIGDYQKRGNMKKGKNPEDQNRWLYYSQYYANPYMNYQE